MSIESIDEPGETDVREPRWFQLAITTLATAAGLALAIWAMTSPGLDLAAVVVCDLVALGIVVSYIYLLMRSPRQAQ